MLALAVDCALATSVAVSHHSPTLRKGAITDTSKILACAKGKTIAASNETDAEMGNVPCLFKIKVPHTKPGDTVKIIGSADSLGNWKVDRAVTLKTCANAFPWYFSCGLSRFCSI